ncbi:hypothetical protein BJ912DRAFT_632507 [Pholiota molesta]|nr:hypothetical protein BJ912DRAFT_632507 [Pholiota molesta]
MLHSQAFHLLSLLRSTKNNVSTPTSTATKLAYFLPPKDGVRAYQSINADPITGQRKNFGYEEKDVVIENVRGKEDTISLDTTGFQYYKHPSQHKAFKNDDDIRAEYYPESADLIKKVTGASRVVFFDHTIRRHRPGHIGDDSPDTRQPVSGVHVDQSSAASIARVHRHLPAEEVPSCFRSASRSSTSGAPSKILPSTGLWRCATTEASTWRRMWSPSRSSTPTAKAKLLV